VQRDQQGLEGPGRQRRGRLVPLVGLEGVQTVALVDLLGLVRKEHGIAVEGDAHFVGMGIGSPRAVREHARRRHARLEGRADVGFVGRQEQVGRQRAQVAPGRLTPREDAAFDGQAVVLGRAEHAHARDGVVARQDHHLDARRVGIERQQLAHQREGHAGRGRLVQALQLQLHVGAVVAGFEEPVLFLEVE